MTAALRHRPAPSDFGVTAELMGRDTLVRLSGEIDIASCGDLRDALEPHLDSGRNLIIDLGRVTFMDSSVLTVLLHAKSALATASRSLRLDNPSRAARRLLSIEAVRLLLDLDQPPTG